MNTNRVSATLSTTDQEAVMAALGVIREKLPFLIDLTTAEREMRKDAQLLGSLSSIRLAIDLLQKQIDDTVVQVGAEADAASRTVYAVTKTPYAGAILRTAADDMGKRFGRKPRSAAAEPAPSTPAPAPGNHNA